MISYIHNFLLNARLLAQRSLSADTEEDLDEKLELEEDAGLEDAEDGEEFLDVVKRSTSHRKKNNRLRRW